MTPSIAPRTIGIIDGLDWMSEDAAHALLKTIEEPSGKTILFLLCETPRTLLATIRSRTQHIALTEVSEKEMLRALLARGVNETGASDRDQLDGSSRVVTEEKAKDIVLWSFGLPGRALRLCEHSETMEKERAELERLSEMLAHGGIAARMQYAEELAARKPLEIIGHLELFLGFLRMRVRQGEGEAHARASDALRRLLFARRLLVRSPLNPRLVLEVALVNTNLH